MLPEAIAIVMAPTDTSRLAPPHFVGKKVLIILEGTFRIISSHNEYFFFLRTHGIFHLTDPGGISVIRNCQQRGFHPHEEPDDGGAIYEDCSHVYMNLHLKFEVLDLR